MALPVVLFGAFDRHNFGDLLFPHVAEALLGRPAIACAGLARRDLRDFGGHEVVPLAEVATRLGGTPAALVHAGGEILDCTAWQAAVMLQDPGGLPQAIAYLEAHPDERQRWVWHVLGTDALAPYTSARNALPGLQRLAYDAVGGVGLDAVSGAMRTEVLTKLREADFIGVRDRLTLTQLAQAGIKARLMPDPAVMVAELFGGHIRAREQQGEVAAVCHRLPQGHVAVQFSADFGDDATLAALAAALDEVAMRTGHGIAFFRAGAAPWHDDAALFRRVATLMRTGRVQLLESLDCWDICALLATSRAYCGSSLHGRIVATAFGVPRVSLLPAARVQQPSKLHTFAQDWDLPELPGVVAPTGLAAGVSRALEVPAPRLRRTARRLARQHREAFDALRALLG